jgi:hypothetical protein
MGCLFVIVGAFAPRVALVLMWLFTDLVDRAFDGLILPLLGVIVLPFTTLVYVLAYNPARAGPSTLGWIFVAIGFLIDLGSYGSAARKRRADAR